MFNTNINFFKQYKFLITLSIVTIIAFFVLNFTKGLQLGVEFTGGQLLELETTTSYDLEQVKQVLAQNDIKAETIQFVGDSRHLLLRLKNTEKDNTQSLNQATKINTILSKINPDSQINKSEFIGPSVGEELKTDGLVAFISALFMIFFYVSLRFNMKMAISSILSLIHDAGVVLLFFIIFNLTFDISVFAALLAIVGYSLNDNIVIFDRVRSNFILYPSKTSYEIFTLSVNQMLTRTILTSGVTLFAVGAMMIFGGEALSGFALALLIGVIIGTYSTIYVACGFSILFNVQPIIPAKINQESENEYYKKKFKQEEIP